MLKRLAFLLLAAGACAFAQIRISQVYGGGGNAGATYRNDFIELFNAGSATQSLAGYSVQYTSAAGSGTWQVTALTGNIAPGHYYLVQEAAGANVTTTTVLPAPDATGTIPMSATDGKVALVSSTTALSGSCPTTTVVDQVGYGSANCHEGATAAPVLTNTTADFRRGGGCTDSNSNSADFATPTAAANPRNGSSSANACISVSSVSLPEGNSGTTNFNFAVSLNINAPATVTFNATTADGTATAGSDYTALSNAPFSIAAGQSTTTVTVLVTGDTTVEPDETFTVTLSSVSGASPTTLTAVATGTIQNDDSVAVTLSFSPSSLPDGTEGVSYSQALTVNNGSSCSFSTSGSVPPGLSLGFTGTTNTATLSGTPSLSGSFSFTVSANCAEGSTFQNYTVNMAFACETGVKTTTAIHTIQGTANTSPLAGQTVEVEGIVVGSFQASSQLNGFYLQEPDSSWDGNDHTSEGIFVFDPGAPLAVSVGDRVRLKGTVSEFSSATGSLTSSLTEIGGVTSRSRCSTGNTFTRTSLSLPITNVSDWEQYEGMAVQFPQQLTVSGNFDLGSFDQLQLAPQVLYVPTQSVTQANWQSQADLNARSVIVLDDASTLANATLYPTAFPQGGLSASSTLRDGALVNYDSNAHTHTPLTGILDDRFGAYRVQTTDAVTFYNANARPADINGILTNVGGRFRVVSANVLNFFTSFNGRGAANQTEFDHQKAKIIAELSSMNADIYGLSEVQNFDDGQTDNATNNYTNAALQSLVDGLNAATAPNTFALINTLSLGASNGTDAIRSAIVYKPSRMTPVGSPAEYYQNDTNRPTLAQTFQPASGAKASQQTFTVVVNHFRSKSSACGAGNDDALQGNCNGTRLTMAANVVNWLAANPTGDPAGANRKYLLVGDYNAYLGEDPIQYFATHGYTNLIAGMIGPNAYSYNFGAQAGYLDHALANAAFNMLIKNVAEWHINADEPSALEALNSSAKSPAAQAAYYAATPYAASDHDPFIVGLNPLPGDLNDDGVVDAADQAIVTAAVGKPASAVDRRMDFDGDGKITLNDYRLWVNYYRAFLQ